MWCKRRRIKYQAGIPKRKRNLFGPCRLGIESMPFVYLLHFVLTVLGFKALSDWMVAHSGQHISIVDVWCEEIGKCKTSQIELFLWLLNLVVRHKDGKAYICYFRTIIETVFTKAVRGITADVYTSMYKAPHIHKKHVRRWLKCLLSICKTKCSTRQSLSGFYVQSPLFCEMGQVHPAENIRP